MLMKEDIKMEMMKAFVFYSHTSLFDLRKSEPVFTLKPINQDDLDHYSYYLQDANHDGLNQIPMTKELLYDVFFKLSSVGFSKTAIDTHNSVKALLINPKNNDKVIYKNQLFYIYSKNHHAFIISKYISDSLNEATSNIKAINTASILD